jgi:putative pyruvate formate lyase activating enzyme
MAGEQGRCRAGATARVFQAQTDMSDEQDIAPAFGICLSGCNLRCDFCVTGARSWDAEQGIAMSAQNVAARACQALQQGARSIQFMGGEPVIHPLFLLETIALLPKAACLVLKTNGLMNDRSLNLLDSLFDVWCVDYKFGNDACASRLSGLADYCRPLQEGLLRLAQRKSCQEASNQPRLIIRHLLMPGHMDCCWTGVARWVAANLPGAALSLRTGFWPGWKSGRHAELRRTTSPEEEAQARRIAADLGIPLAA